jgi:hypothetical protein
VDLVRTGFEHKEELAGIAQMVLGGLLPQPNPQGIEALLKQQPPSTAAAPPIDPLPRSKFQRRRVEQPIDGEGAVIDNDIHSETAGQEITDANDRAESNDQLG